ncbi:MAG TPA: hypothetical protein VFP91_05390 [Vicinamibacterales bacterium]|nr:hypothetical protein [Vicinamibacterales bacterium]
MRGYYVPLVSGLVLVASAFLPWVIIGDTTLPGIPNVPALWVAGLGAIAAVLATLSIITRKNSRHPLLVVGLIALGIMVLSWRILPRSVSERAASLSQANAIVEGGEAAATPDALIGVGIYIGTVASALIALFGLTIVVKRVQRPYTVASQDDDV